MLTTKLFQHRMDPEVRKELDAIKFIQDAVVHDIKNFEDIAFKASQSVADLATEVQNLEQKMDEILKLLDDHGSIKSGETPKPEPLGVMPGHTPWSQRKKQREAESRSPKFIDKVTKGAAITEKPDGTV